MNRITIKNVQRDFPHGPPSQVTLRYYDGLIDDVPVTVFSAGLQSRGLPDFGRFVFEQAMNEPNDMAGTALFERVVQDACPPENPTESSVILTMIDTEQTIADIPSTVSSSGGGLTARGLSDFGAHQLQKAMQEVCGGGCPALTEPPSPTQPGPCPSIPALGV